MSPYNVVITTLNSQYIHSSLAPWCLLAGIRTYGNDSIVPVVEEGTINEPLEAIVTRIVSHAPDAVAIGCYIWNIAQVKKLLPLLKNALPDLTVILGGPEVGFSPKETLLTLPQADFVLSGEGEFPLANLLNRLSMPDAVTPSLPMPGVSERTPNGILLGELYQTNEEPPSPYTPEYFACLNGRIAYLETSRGCPFSCAFCLSGGSRLRYFSLDRVKKEILALAESGTKTVKFVDRTFNANSKRAYAITEFILKEVKTPVCFHYEIAGDLLQEDFLQLLATAPKGRFQLEIGLQSFNETTLAAVYRKTDTQKLQDNIRRLLALGNMHIHIDLIAGLPYEDLESFQKSFLTAFSLQPHMLQLGFLKLIHGSAMREKSDEFPCRYHSDAPYEVFETPWLSEEDLLLLHRTENALDKLYNSGRFPKTIAYALSQIEDDPFAFFASFPVIPKMSLDDLTNLLYRHLVDHYHLDAAVLRDIMVLDHIATCKSGRFPSCLFVQDPAIGNYRTHLKIPPESKRSLAILYTQKRIVYADYTDWDPVKKAYRICDAAPLV